MEEASVPVSSYQVCRKASLIGDPRCDVLPKEACMTITFTMQSLLETPTHNILGLHAGVTGDPSAVSVLIDICS